MPRAKKKKYFWSVETTRVNMIIAKSTWDALEVEAKKKNISASKLARFFIERSLSLPAPGMSNSDFRMWEND